ncbi:superoxide dismutase family protein [Nonomuraea spiralis]|uniref:Superoxide dismutase [Cu-Zn] n=1 Tax=Nonomuraea spiralis TaxID=46182 RepID=A0ABV5IQ95_9ACTN|nr:superoxide dismutase family protein [Nonomuraea spiralis]GGT11747.1 superoxide dismutase [Cu-Zn] [Nonomuraea spiralis]
MAGKVRLTLVAVLGVGAVALGAAALGRMVPAPDGGPADAMMPARDGARAGAVIRDAAGRTVGSLQVEDAGNGRTKITVGVKDLPAGFHGFHVHAKGVCDPRSEDPATGSPFFSAGGHYDLGSHPHDHHSGDLPGLLVGADGTGTASTVTDRFRGTQLFDDDGSAIMIHAVADNHANIPDRYRNAEGAPGPDAETLKAGDSGRRIACGVITRS